MKCRACDAELAENALFCHRCGQKIEVEGPSDRSNVTSAAALGSGSATGELHSTGSLQERLVRQSSPDDPEEQLWEGRYSGKDMIGTWILAVLITAGFVIAGVYFWDKTLWLVILAVLVLLFGYVLLVYLRRWLGVRYRLTTQRFFHEHGIFRHVTDRIEVIDMDDVTTVQTLLQRIGNVGRIAIASSDSTHPKLILDGIDNVHRVAQMIDDARRRERMRRGLHIETT